MSRRLPFFCAWWMAPLCWADHTFGCRWSVLCRLHDGAQTLDAHLWNLGPRARP